MGALPDLFSFRFLTRDDNMTPCRILVGLYELVFVGSPLKTATFYKT
jgi:hypothetical protein